MKISVAQPISTQKNERLYETIISILYLMEDLFAKYPAVSVARDIFHFS